MMGCNEFGANDAVMDSNWNWNGTQIAHGAGVATKQVPQRKENRNAASTQIKISMHDLKTFAVKVTIGQEKD